MSAFALFQNGNGEDPNSKVRIPPLATILVKFLFMLIIHIINNKNI
jgi:hypothetical protein